MTVLFIAEILNRGRLREQLIIEAKDDDEANKIAQDHVIAYYKDSLKTIKIKIVKPITILKDEEYITPFYDKQKYICPVEGCNSFIEVKGHCGMHYQQMRKSNEIRDSIDEKKLKDRELIIRDLKRRGKTFKDIGDLFGITHQRVEAIYNGWR